MQYGSRLWGIWSKYAVHKKEYQGMSSRFTLLVRKAESLARDYSIWETERVRDEEGKERRR
jgi:oligoribonuclease NrnB/cAMP/cGMP phosphodiesterase (DHH superfamily)